VSVGSRAAIVPRGRLHRPQQRPPNHEHLYALPGPPDRHVDVDDALVVTLVDLCRIHEPKRTSAAEAVSSKEAIVRSSPMAHGVCRHDKRLSSCVPSCPSMSQHPCCQKPQKCRQMSVSVLAPRTLLNPLASGSSPE